MHSTGVLHTVISSSTQIYFLGIQPLDPILFHCLGSLTVFLEIIILQNDSGFAPGSALRNHSSGEHIGC